MDKVQFATAMKHLGIAYNKEFTQDELEVFYEYLKDYNFTTLKIAIKELIKNNKFLPKIAELVEMCDSKKENNKHLILELMLTDGYFKTNLEYEKTSKFIEKGTIPKWLQQEMDKYIPKLEEKKLLN